MEIKLPERLEDETISEHDARCGAVLADAFSSMGIDPDSVYPTSIGEVVQSDPDKITMNVTMSYERFKGDA